jgi:uncharacterized membrane protein YbhN (UPF0104 family)
MTGSRRLFLRALRFLVPLAAVLVLARVVDLGGALRIAARVEPARFAAVLALFGIGQVLSCLRWRLALGQIAPSPPGIPTLLRLYLIGMFVNLGLPTMAGGDVVRAELTRRHVGARGDAYASILADRLIGLLAVVLLALVATLFARTLFGPEVRRLVLAAAVVFALMLAALAPVLVRLRGRAGGGPFGRFVDALLLLARRPRFLAASLSIAVVVQALAVVAPTALLADALGIEVPLALHFVLVPVIVLVTQVPLAPGGLGVRETAFVLLYGQVGVPAEAAFSLGLGWSLVLLTFGLSGGVLLAAGQYRGRSKRQTW